MELAPSGPTRQGSVIQLGSHKGKAKYMKDKVKRHHALLFYIFLMIAGSALWLKYALKGDRTGQPMYQPVYLQTFGNGLKIVDGVSVNVEFDRCEFRERGETTASGQPVSAYQDATACGADTASVRVTATIGNVSDSMDGLYLTLRASKDFKTWWQANKVLVPRDNFNLIEPTMTAGLNRTLESIYSEAKAQPLISASGSAGASPAAVLDTQILGLRCALPRMSASVHRAARHHHQASLPSNRTRISRTQRG